MLIWTDTAQTQTQYHDTLNRQLICNDVGHAAVAVLSVNIKQEAEKPKIKI